MGWSNKHDFHATWLGRVEENIEDSPSKIFRQDGSLYLSRKFRRVMPHAMLKALLDNPEGFEEHNKA